MNSPEGNQKDLIGRKGVNALKDMLIDLKVLSFEVPVDSDYGLDVIAYLPILYVENEDTGNEDTGKALTDRMKRYFASVVYATSGTDNMPSLKMEVSGALLAFQVKTHECIDDAENRKFWSENIKTSTLEHWRSSQLPVVLVIYDMATKTMRCRLMQPSDYDERLHTQKTIAIHCHDVLDSERLHELLRTLRWQLHRKIALESVANLYDDNPAKQLESVRRGWMLIDDITYMKSPACAFPFLQEEARDEAMVLLSSYKRGYQRLCSQRIRDALASCDLESLSENEAREIEEELKTRDATVQANVDALGKMTSLYPLSVWGSVLSGYESTYLLVVTQPDALRFGGQTYMKPSESWPDTDKDMTLDEADRIRQDVLAYEIGEVDAAVGLLSYLDHPERVIELLYDRRNDDGFNDLFDTRDGRWWLSLYMSAFSSDNPSRTDDKNCIEHFRNRLTQDGFLQDR